MLDLRLRRQIINGLPAQDSDAGRTDAQHSHPTRTNEAFHKRRQHGRELLLELLAPAAGSRVVELGAGAGTMIDLWGARLQSFAALELVDICPAMLAQARARATGHHNIRVVESDATAYRAPWQADCVYFSYALTMIPDWVRALNNALAMLKPGGKLGIVDFYVAGGRQQYCMTQHASLTRWLWTYWFSHHQVRLSERHLAALCTLTDKLHLHEGQGPLPGLPLLRAPYYVFVGANPSRPRPDLINDLWKKSATQP